MFLMLPPADSAALSSRMLANVAAEFQPQLEMFRLRHLSGADQFVSTKHPLSRFELVCNFGACVPEDPEIVRILTPLFESHQQDVLAQRSYDPRVAILETVWTPSHDQDDMAAGEITKRVNAILWSRGENREYSVKEIGLKLRNLNLGTSSNGKHKVLMFRSTTRAVDSPLFRKKRTATDPEFCEGFEILLVPAGHCVFLPAFNAKTILSRRVLLDL
jgi:hypothetical protein